MFWANFLHIYQPPTQKPVWIKRITEESYRKVFSGLLKIKRAQLTLNINGVLCELLEKHGGADVLDNIRELLRRGQAELTGSAKYHAFLPLIPENEIERQIKLNEETLNKYFGGLWKKSGFFPPEMAYSEKVARVASRLGYNWTILDELAFPEGKKPSSQTIYQIKNVGNFGVFFRERNFSFLILSANAGTVPVVLNFLGERIAKEEYAITAMDGETFGHHRPGLENLLFDLYREEKIKSAKLSDLRQIFKEGGEVAPRNSTWAITKSDVKKGASFSRWRHPDNVVQKKQWELTNLAIETVNRRPAPEARGMLDRALHSDQYWWASARPWWSLEMIERGAHELKSTILASPAAGKEEKRMADDLYREIIYTGFEWQRTGKVDQISRLEDEEVQERLEVKEKLFITEGDYRQMIKTLKEQVGLAAKTKEFHRAAMIQDRIRELKEEMEKSAHK